MVKAIPNKIVMISDDTAYMELIADSETDLSELTSVEGIDVGFGSLCRVIATGEIWVLNSEGSWINQTINNPSAENSSSSAATD